LTRHFLHGIHRRQSQHRSDRSVRYLRESARLRHGDEYAVPLCSQPTADVLYTAIPSWDDPDPDADDDDSVTPLRIGDIDRAGGTHLA